MTTNFKTLLTLLLSFNLLVWADSETEGSYEVPVAEEELVQSSEFNSDYKTEERDGKIVRMKYIIPLELTGESNRIDISYTGDSEFPWSGDLAKGTCNESNGEFSCNLIYEKDKLNLDAEKAETSIRNRFAGNEEEIQRRLRVSEIFRSEPAGTTRFMRY